MTTGGANPGGSNTGGAAAGGAATGGAPSGGTGTGGASCTAATCSGTCCDTACVNLASDPAHCGSCTTVCNVGRTCGTGKCAGGWLPMAPPPAGFVARQKAAYTTFNDKLFVFGGADANNVALGDAAIYDPATNTWTLVTAPNAPSPRWGATAVWTGAQILVFGGRSIGTAPALADGASYDPAAAQWSAMNSDSVGHTFPVGGASSSRAVFWGGWGATATTLVGSAERYDISGNSWQAAPSASPAPGAVQDPAWAFTGTNLYLVGGLVGGTTRTTSASSYSLTSNTWTALAAAPTGFSRSGSFGAWDTHSFFAWAGRDGTGARNDGYYYYGGTWSTMGGTGAPTARYASHRQTGWAFVIDAGNIVFLGGLDTYGNPLTDGSRYYSTPTSGGPNWISITGWLSGEQHLWAVAGYAGGEVLVWGGIDGTQVTATGDRWAP
jgi:hypothetical protein